MPNSSLNSYRPWLLKKSSLLATQLVLMVQFAMLLIITDKVQAIVLVNPGGLDKGGWLANMMIKSLGSGPIKCIMGSLVFEDSAAGANMIQYNSA